MRKNCLNRKILIIGLGSIGKRHARLLKEILPDSTIIGVRRRLDSTPPEHVDQLCDSLELAIRQEPDFAVISSPAPFHLEQAMALAHAGVPLFIEKPLSSDTQGILALLDLCREQNLLLIVGYNLRYLASLACLRTAITQGLIGTCLSVQADVGQHLASWRPDQDYRKAVSAQAALGGGVLLELSHELDYLQWLFGPAQWVFAEFSHASDLEIDVEDTADLILGFQPPSSQAFTAALHLDFIRYDTRRTCTIVGSKGTLVWNAILNRVDHFDPSTHQWAPLFQAETIRDETYRAQWNSFLSALDKGQQDPLSGQSALNVLYTIEAARLSQAQGQKIIPRHYSTKPHP